DMTLQEKSIVQGACHRANHLAIAEYSHYNAFALEQLVKDHGVQVRQFPDDVMAALASASKAVLTEMAAGDDITRRIFDSYKASFQREQEWSRISDEAYLTIRRSVFSL
ncbi:MAG: ABC transporter substrate-binding protein, partial [Amphiplicatus sp.]